MQLQDLKTIGLSERQVQTDMWNHSVNISLTTYVIVLIFHTSFLSCMVVFLFLFVNLLGHQKSSSLCKSGVEHFKILQKRLNDSSFMDVPRNLSMTDQEHFGNFSGSCHLQLQCCAEGYLSSFVTAIPTYDVHHNKGYRGSYLCMRENVIDYFYRYDCTLQTTPNHLSSQFDCQLI